MVFNPLFLQNTTGVENIHPEKVNKLNSSGYLFSDIINVFMNADENDSLTKLTQEFLGSAQIKESNGTPVILSLLGELSIPLADVTKNLQLKIEDFLPSGLKKKLVNVEGGNSKDVLEKSLTANKEQLEQILQTINNLFNLGKTSKNNPEKESTDLTAAADLLEKSDGVFLIVETADKVFNINISKEQDTNTSDSKNGNGNNENLYKIKFTLINENSILNSQGSGVLAVNKAQNDSQLSFLPFESELAAENINNNPSVKLKVFSYQNSGSENVLDGTQKNKINLIDGSKQAGNEKAVAEKTPVQESGTVNKENVLTPGNGNSKATETLAGEAEKEVEGLLKKGEKVVEVKNGETKTERSTVLGDGKEHKNYEQRSAETLKNEFKNGEIKLDSSSKAQVKEAVDTLPKNELKESPENKKDTFDNVEKTPKEKINEQGKKESSIKSFEKFALENKENEQLNIKVNKAVKHITTVKPEASQHQAADKPVKENSENKTNTVEEKTGSVKKAELNEKSFSQNENSFKQADDNKHTPMDANKINSTQAKEKFTLDAPIPNSNSERIVKVAEIMKEISKFIEKQDKSTLTIKVSPEELGRLKITLDINNHNIKANIHVENEAVKAIIEKNIADLQNQMSKSGIQLTSVNISLSDNEQKTAKQFVNKKKSSSVELNENNADEKEEEKVKMMGYNTVEYLA